MNNNMRKMNKKIKLSLCSVVIGVVVGFAIISGCVIVLCSDICKGDINIEVNLKIGSVLNFNFGSTQQIDASDQTVIMVEGVQIPSAIEKTSVETCNLWL